MIILCKKWGENLHFLHLSNLFLVYKMKFNNLVTQIKAAEETHFHKFFISCLIVFIVFN